MDLLGSWTVRSYGKLRCNNIVGVGIYVIWKNMATDGKQSNISDKEGKDQIV